MNSLRLHLLSLFGIAIFALGLVGCKGKKYKLRSVEGKVTHQGEPISGLMLFFTPARVDGEHVVGPWSRGTTNSRGEFTLSTRYKENGAVVGLHNVSFQYEDFESDDLLELREELNELNELDEAGGDDEGVADERQRIKNEIKNMKSKLKSGPRFSEDFTLQYEVIDGVNQPVFEVGENNKANYK